LHININELKIYIMENLTKQQLLNNKEIINVASNEIYEVLERSPYNDDLFIPTENSIFIRKKGSKSYDIYRGCFVDFRSLLNNNFKTI